MLSCRSEQEELMDLPSTSRQEFELALQDLQWVNKLFQQDKAIINGIESLQKKWPDDKAWSVLDLGCGSADIPVRLIEWGRSQGIELHITAVDLNPMAVAFARECTEAYPEITVVQANALTLDYPDNSFDVVISSLFLHHLENEQGVRLLQEMARLCRKGLVLLDLERHLVSYIGLKALGKLFGKGRVFQHDAPLSVHRAYNIEELKIICSQSGVQDLKIIQKHPFRLVLLWEKPSSPIITP
jgi:SAM-dependent methyltransferase